MVQIQYTANIFFKRITGISCETLAKTCSIFKLFPVKVSIVYLQVSPVKIAEFPCKDGRVPL
jgi:hypothetical protein